MAILLQEKALRWRGTGDGQPTEKEPHSDPARDGGRQHQWEGGAGGESGSLPHIFRR